MAVSPRSAPRARQLGLAERFADKMPAPTKRAFERESPPVNEHPSWARPIAPERDEAALVLYQQEYASAGVFWGWLTVTYRDIRSRMWTGYRYLEGLDGKNDEAEGLYRSLGSWLHWLETAWWLLTQWYGQQVCRSLPFPLHAAHDGNGRPLRIVKEYRGLKGEVLLEEALRLWRDYAILTHQLPDIGDAPDAE